MFLQKGLQEEIEKEKINQEDNLNSYSEGI